MAAEAPTAEDDGRETSAPSAAPDGRDAMGGRWLTHFNGGHPFIVDYDVDTKTVKVFAIVELRGEASLREYKEGEEDGEQVIVVGDALSRRRWDPTGPTPRPRLCVDRSHVTEHTFTDVSWFHAGDLLGAENMPFLPEPDGDGLGPDDWAFFRGHTCAFGLQDGRVGIVGQLALLVTLDEGETIDVERVVLESVRSDVWYTSVWTNRRGLIVTEAAPGAGVPAINRAAFEGAARAAPGGTLGVYEYHWSHAETRTVAEAEELTYTGDVVDTTPPYPMAVRAAVPAEPAE